MRGATRPVLVAIATLFVITLGLVVSGDRQQLLGSAMGESNHDELMSITVFPATEGKAKQKVPITVVGGRKKGEAGVSVVMTDKDSNSRIVVMPVSALKAEIASSKNSNKNKNKINKNKSKKKRFSRITFVHKDAPQTEIHIVNIRPGPAGSSSSSAARSSSSGSSSSSDEEYYRRARNERRRMRREMRRWDRTIRRLRRSRRRIQHELRHESGRLSRCKDGCSGEDFRKIRRQMRELSSKLDKTLKKETDLKQKKSKVLNGGDKKKKEKKAAEKKNNKKNNQPIKKNKKRATSVGKNSIYDEFRDPDLGMRMATGSEEDDMSANLQRQVRRAMSEIQRHVDRVMRRAKRRVQKLEQ